MSHLVQRLGDRHAGLLARHFVALDSEATNLRFGHALSSAARRHYARSIDFSRDAVFGVIDDEGRLQGVAHVARLESSAEVGLSVLRRHRGRGIGRALLSRAITHARSLGLSEVQLLCLPHNRVMAGLAASLGMRLESVDGMTLARARLPPPTAFTFCEELLAGEWARLDRLFRGEFQAMRGWARPRAGTQTSISARLSRVSGPQGT